MIALFFDTETTGLKSKQNPGFNPALVQLGAILQDTESGTILAEVNLIAQQVDNKPIPIEASNIHGITDDMAEKYGSPLKLVDMVFANLIAKADVIVAHNIDYDLDVVHDNMPFSQERIVNKKHFCTMDKNVYKVKAPLTMKQRAYYTSKGEKPDKPYKSPSLSETYKHYFHTTFDGAHDAMNDIRACRDVYFEMHKSKKEVEAEEPVKQVVLV
jgi:DNA polymerase-3 subunit epsilon